MSSGAVVQVCAPWSGNNGCSANGWAWSCGWPTRPRINSRLESCTTRCKPRSLTSSTAGPACGLAPLAQDPTFHCRQSQCGSSEAERRSSHELQPFPTHPRSGSMQHWAVGSRTELEAIADQLLSVVMLLAHDPIARRLRRCDWEECQRFYVAVRDHKRGHSFCSEEHRRLFDVATRDPAEAAAYMREWRKNRARERNRAARKAKR